MPFDRLYSISHLLSQFGNRRLVLPISFFEFVHSRHIVPDKKYFLVGPLGGDESDGGIR